MPEVLERAAQRLARLDGEKHQSQDQDQIPPSFGLIHFPLRMQILDSNSRLAKEDHSSGNEMLQETSRNFI